MGLHSAGVRLVVRLRTPDQIDPKIYPFTFAAIHQKGNHLKEEAWLSDLDCIDGHR